MSDEQGSDSPEDSFERLQRDFNRTLEKHKHPRRSLYNLFPERENNKPRFRKSVIDRAVARILKNKVVSSTPMPCGKKLNFTPDSSAMISPIDDSNNTQQPPQNEPEEIITVSSSNNISQRNTSPDKDASAADKSSRILRSAVATSKQSIGTSALNLSTQREKVPVSKVKKSSIAVQTSKKSLDAPGPSGRKIARNLFANTRGRQTQTTDSLKMNRCGGTPELTSSDDSSISIINEVLAPVEEAVKSLRFSEHLPAPWRCPSGTAVGFMNNFSNVTQGNCVLDSYERSPDEDETFRPQPPKKLKVFQNRKKTIAVLDNAKIRPPDDGFENLPPVEDNNDFRSTDEDESFRPQPPKKGKVFQNRKKAITVSADIETRPPDDASKNPPPLDDNNDFRAIDEDKTSRPQAKVLQNRKKTIAVLDNIEIMPPDDGFKNTPPVEDSNGFETDDEQSEHEAPRKKSGSARKNIDRQQQQHSLTNKNVDQVDNFVENTNNADDDIEAADKNDVTLTNPNESDEEIQKSTKKRANRVVSSDNESLEDDAKEVNDRPAKGKQVKKAKNVKIVKKRKTAANSSRQNPNSTVVARTTMPSILISEPTEGLRRSTRERKPVPPKAIGVVFVKSERALKLYNGTESTSSLTLSRSSVSAKNSTKNRNLASVCTTIHEEQEEAGPSTSKTKRRRILKRTTTTTTTSQKKPNTAPETKTKSRRVSKKTVKNAAPTPPPQEIIESRPNTPQSNRETGYGSGSGPDTNTEDLDTIHKYQEGKLCALKWSAHRANLVFKPMDGYENIDIGASLSQSQSWGLGILKIHPGATKPRQKPNKHNMAFTVLEGEALVTLEGKSLKHSVSDQFFVYTGCEYSIKNLSDTRPLELSFVRFVPVNR